MKAQSTEGQDTIWLVSFGDLLTLLVCFFLAMAQVGIKSVPAKIDKPVPIQAVAPINEERAKELNSGTTLAFSTPWGHRPVEYPALIVETVLFHDDFVTQVGELSVRGIERLRKELKQSFSQAERIEIEACNPNARENSRMSAQSVLGIRRTVSELGADPTRMTLRVVENQCDEILHWTPVTEEVVGVVRLLKKFQ